MSPDGDPKLLSFNGYSLLADLNEVKSRAGIHVKNGIDYVRRSDLELRNIHPHHSTFMSLWF